MPLLVFTLVQAPEAGWGSVRTVGSLLGAGLILTAFVQIERRVPAPLVRPGLLRSPQSSSCAADDRRDGGFERLTVDGDQAGRDRTADIGGSIPPGLFQL